MEVHNQFEIWVYTGGVFRLGVFRAFGVTASPVAGDRPPVRSGEEGSAA